jgi:uncharacterized protein (TIGR02231 family)
MGIGEAATPEVEGVYFYPSGAKFIFKIEADSNFDVTLPGAFEPDSVRFLERENVDNVRVESRSREEWVPPALLKLKSQIEVADRSLKLLLARESALEKTMSKINAPLPQGFNGKNLIFFIENSRSMLSDIGVEMVDLNLEIEKSRKQLTELQSEYKKKMPGNADKAVLISGASTSEGSLLFEAYSGFAGWSVQYDMNLDSTTGSIDAKMRAEVWQNTGLDVVGEFTFHSRQPSFAIYPPNVLPLSVILQPLKLPRGNMDSLMEKDIQFTQAPLAMNSLGIRTEGILPPSFTLTLADVSVAGKGNIKGDGTPANVELGKFNLICVPVLVSIPEQNREAWVIASMDSIPEPLLPGRANLAVDGVITGKSIIPEYGMGQTYLPFGMASRLTSKKIGFIGKTASSWLGKGILEDGYTLEITNGMATEREVTVKDRIPFPVNDRISLEVTRIEPQAERDRENRLTWKVKIKPGETKKIYVEFKLQYPSDMTLGYR